MLLNKAASHARSHTDNHLKEPNLRYYYIYIYNICFIAHEQEAACGDREKILACT